MNDTTLQNATEPKPASKSSPSDLETAREAFTLAWRPAGSMSLGERWLRAGESEEPRRGLPPRPPALPKDARPKLRKLKK